MGKKVSIIRHGASRPVVMDARVADKLVQSGRFSYAGDAPSPTLSRPKRKVAAADAPRSAPTRSSAARPLKAQAQATTQSEEVALDALTKAEIVDVLRKGGRRVDTRKSKADLLKEAKRYQRRDMRAEP